MSSVLQTNHIDASSLFSWVNLPHCSCRINYFLFGSPKLMKPKTTSFNDECNANKSSGGHRNDGQ
uniref:Uncharacterized protein n=1 Tax=Oryza punctata TaxID=4537 RepID=A0A0E0M6B4_ORYPU